MTDRFPLRREIRWLTHAPETHVLGRLAAFLPDNLARKRTEAMATRFVEHLRKDARPALMEVFLAEFGLNTDEGVALMCLAEALLRVPDAETMDALIEDKIAPSDWGKHLGAAHSPLVNASTWALFLTGKVLEKDESVAGVLRNAIKRLGEPVIRKAVRGAMKEMGRQFVLGETIESAMTRASKREARGETYSYDMLGEAARTEADALRYMASYAHAIAAMAGASGSDVRTRPGISVKLSALYERYEPLQRDRVMTVLVPRVKALALQAAAANIGFNIDAEEADRLDLSLDVIEAVLSDPGLAGWDGFGVVVQAYGKRASAVIHWLHRLACDLDRRIMVRLVKGAYWDTEIKHAQTMGLSSYPVFTRKVATDTSYIACAQQLSTLTDRLYPQFATHNAHTVAAVLDMKIDTQDYEFQRLHGMGEALHDHVRARHGAACRIYAPVGAHRDLLAYLVRRLLENGANSSFVNQIVDEARPISDLVADPIAATATAPQILPEPLDIFAPRQNSRGMDWADPDIRADLRRALEVIATKTWTSSCSVGTRAQVVTSPGRSCVVGTAFWASEKEARRAVEDAQPWTADPTTRKSILLRAATLYEYDRATLISLLMREAGKTLTDCINEIREAIDFLRYYADFSDANAPLGRVTCISPWNFPLAIFTGQVAAALAAGNAVVAKPAEQTSLIADVAVGLLHRAGVPRHCLQLVLGKGAEVGPVLTGKPGINGVVFTGSTATAQHINRTMAANLAPGTPLIAETGGQNAMIVDSTALLEQAVRDIVASAFQSAGQRCSALRMLYVQEDIAGPLLEMLKGAMDAMVVGDAEDFATDVGPIIDAPAKDRINAHIAASVVLHQGATGGPQHVAPTLLSVNGINDLQDEVFGPVCHFATFASGDLDRVIADINGSGYALTFGLHSRIDSRVEAVSAQVRAGNIYVNRNQIGAVVGSQPFGGHGLSGTGPKAGGARYVARLHRDASLPHPGTALSLPGPTGESNRYHLHPRGQIGCFGPEPADLARQMEITQATGAKVIDCTSLPLGTVAGLGLDGAVYWGPDGRAIAMALAECEGAIVPLWIDATFETWIWQEQVVSVDTTASGGNATLLARMDAGKPTQDLPATD
jgi:RHH-type proline utilization regulon transcriptional repressor/proline dehydrogenase/delta 1-pyrroline-5-carboxylate dehydrogenase